MRIQTLVIVLISGLVVPSLSAEPTEVVVRVISQDAKFIGDSMGGASVTMHDAKTNRILAQGKTTGGTGDTNLIMQRQGRSPQMSTPDAASFSAKFDIDQPTLVNLEVTGPIGRPGSAIKVLSQRWVMPGESVNVRDGWVIELPGLAVTPVARVKNSAQAEGDRILGIDAKVELLCGCPITPGGLWDSNDYKVTATTWQDGKQKSKSDLHFTKSPGEFSGEIIAPTTGTYNVVLFAKNVKTGNSGMIEVPSVYFAVSSKHGEKSINSESLQQ